MAKPNPSVQKRIRERKKQMRKEEKAKKRAERLAGGPVAEEVTELSDILGFDDEEEEENEDGEEKPES